MGEEIDHEGHEDHEEGKILDRINWIDRILFCHEFHELHELL